MFYELEVLSHIRVPPRLLGSDVKKAIINSLNETYKDLISNELGFVIHVTDLKDVGEGIIIPGDGAAYYETKFKVIVFKPELQEIILGKITEIADFGAFMNIGPVDGMIHISQTMDDYISFTKRGTLVGKESKQVLKVNDRCRARIIAVSYKDVTNPKIGLTMRQPTLGSLTWLQEKAKKRKREKRETRKEN
jgi:DNA-directed RNA polymerase subunit E'